MFTGTTRPYKNDTPFNTVKKIRHILEDLDCVVYEIKWNNPYREVHSVRVETDEKDGKFGTNGKGRNRLYTLASAYAEFVERLQNGLLAGRSFSRLFLNHLKQESGCYFYPDEKFISKEEFDNLPEDYLNDVFASEAQFTSSQLYFDRLKQNGYPGCLAVPYYDVKNERMIYLPHNITQTLTGSNGMAAGNSIAEGVFQGLCELLERYGSAQVFHKQMTPPTIPREYLRQFAGEYAIIEDIEKDADCEVIVKDFSAAERLPVLGVIIKDNEKQLYRLNVGSDTSFAIALSRCLTEIHQGLDSRENADKAMLPIPQVEADYWTNNDEESISKRNEQLLLFTKNGSGVYPMSLFGERPSYQFDPTVFTCHDSYEAEVRSLLRLILDSGRNVYR